MDNRTRFERPIFIVSAPRSGSTLLFETLAHAPGLFTIGDESHGIIESIPPLFPPVRGWDSNRLTAADVDDQIAEELASNFYRNLRDRNGATPIGRRIRMLEKTPKNALRVPFFDTVWPDSRFIYLYRDPRQTLASMMRAWQSGRFRTYPRLPEWRGLPWSLLLVPGWHELNGKPLPEIVARQWATTTQVLLDDIGTLPRDRLTAIDYDRFLQQPTKESQRVLGRFGIGWDIDLPPQLPPSRMTLTKPRPDKWLEMSDEVAKMWPVVSKVDERARRFLHLNSVSE